MKGRTVRLLWALPAAGLLLLAGSAAPGVTPHSSYGIAYADMNLIQKRILSGRAAMLFNPTPDADLNDHTAGPANYFPTGDDGCPQRLGNNLKVNVNCENVTDPDLQGRAQAQNETSIAQDPMHPEHILGSFNDYRRGDGNCYGSFSLDGGRNWTDTTIPMGFTRGGPFGAARQYWEAGGDTAVAWDTKGNAYFQCMVFQRGKPVTNNPDLSSAFYVFRSTKNHGASWNFPGRPVFEFADITGTKNVLEDKPLMTVDAQVGSPFQDRVYVTWTEFAADGSAYIWESFSNDYGETFSPRHLISKPFPLCTVTFGAGTPQGPCNENQFSQPFTGSDGALYVSYNNFNNAEQAGVTSDNRGQILLVKSTDGGNTFGSPVKVANYYDLPDCLTYQGKDAGRACVPEKGAGTNSFFRAANYSAGAVNPKNAKEVVVSVASYINGFSNEANGCKPAGINPATGNNLFVGVKTPGACSNSILVSVSKDGGASFTGTTTDPRKLTSASDSGKQKHTDQWFQWIAFTHGGQAAVSYYDRQYGNDETTGFSDISISGSGDLTHWGVRRVTSSSMPPPTQFGGLFWGDYAGLSAAGDDAHPLWSDTRNPELFLCPGTGLPGKPPAVCKGSASNASFANDQDAFTATVDVPRGDEAETQD